MRAFLPLLALAGCFGGGDPPTVATGIEPVFVAPPPGVGQECSNSVYIGSVAFGLTRGFAVTVPYIPSGGSVNCCPNGQCPNPSSAGLQLYSFDKQGQTPAGSMLTGLPMSQMTGFYNYVQIAARGDVPLWAAPDTVSNNGNIMLSTGQRALASPMGGNLMPASLVADGTAIFVAGWSGGSRQDVSNPSYPCCGNFGQNPMMGSFTRLDTGVTQLPITPRFACDTMGRCLQQNSNQLFYVEYDPLSGQRVVSSFPKASTSASDRRPLFMLDPSLVPVGLAANEQHMTWSESADYIAGPNVAPACEVGRYDLGSDTPRRVLMTNAFSCMGLALDDSMVYMTIVAPLKSDCCESQGAPLLGVGLARFSLDDPQGTFEALDLHVHGAVGPRRIHIEGNDVWAIDPAMILKLDKSALDGAHDFIP